MAQGGQVNRTQGQARTGRRRGGPRRAAIAWALLTVAWTAGRPGPTAQGATDERTASSTEETRSLADRIAELEALVAKLRAEIDSIRAAREEGAGAPTLQELQKRIDALALEIERLRIGEAATTPPAAQGPVPGFGPAASKVYAVKRGVSIGGYGQMLYQDFAARRDDGAPAGIPDTLDLERAVFYFGYKWTDHLLFNSEVEYEHAVSGEGEPGETAVEFAYVDYHPWRRFGMRGGLLLVPLGFLTELHEPPIFHGALRPEVETLIIPSTWRENGLGVYGDLGPISYRAYMVASLNASGFSADQGIREGRQEGAASRAEDLAVTARVDWTPAPGFLLGAAAFTGRTGQGDSALGHPRLTLWDAHAEWNARGVHLRGLYARGILSDAEAVSLAHDPLLAIDPTRGTAIGARTAGWYGEAAFNILTLLSHSERELSPFVRYEVLDTQAEVAPGYSRDPGNDRTVKTYGLTFRPIPNVVLKADVQDFGNRAGTGVDQFNFALGYLF